MADEHLICPYNKSHEIQTHRMQKHLLKCRKQYPDIKLNQCPFNATHMIRDEHFTLHKQTCKDRIHFHVLQEQLSMAQEAFERKQADMIEIKPKMRSGPVFEADYDETWDHECGTQKTIKPRKEEERKRTIPEKRPSSSRYSDEAAPNKADKKKIRHTERERVQNIYDRRPEDRF